jgi:DNA-directed RNA polymerase I, II, and III subunit RPABC2
MSEIEKVYDSENEDFEEEEEMDEKNDKNDETDEEEEEESDDDIPKPTRENITLERDDDYEEDDEDDDEEDNNEEDEEEDLPKNDKKIINYEDINVNINDEEDDDDEEYDENYLQKLDKSIEDDIIVDFHPELKSHNYDEIEILSRVVRDSNGDIIDPFHRTLPFITKYEKARILGERAKQINAGAKTFVSIPENMIDGYLIALKEYEEKKIPFILKRPLPNGAMEYWKMKDLEIIHP